MPLYLTEADIHSLLAPEDALDPIEECFRRQATGAIDNRPRTRQPAGDGAFAVMSAVDSELGLAGVKSYVWVSAGTPFVVLLFDLAEGELATVIEANRLGQLRTGRRQRRRGAPPRTRREQQPGGDRVRVPGRDAGAVHPCGRCRRSSRVVAYCRTEERLQAFCAKVGAEPAESHREAADADVVVTVTTSRDPVLRGEWLRPGALVCAVGANDPRQRELDNVVLERAGFVCCDSREQSRLESGDLIDPVEAGVLDWLEVHELHEVVSGELQGRQSDDDIVVFKSNGIAAWDVAIGAEALARARERGVGQTV